MQTHQLTIAGHRITVRSAAPKAYVEGLARTLDERIRAVGNHAGPVGGVLVAALGLADDLHRAEEALTAVQSGVRDHAESLIAQIDAALEDDDAS